MGEHFTYCPVCQLPLGAICISPELHVSQCMSRSDDETAECPKGVHCLNTDLFHYRDFSHKALAAHRASSDFVPPEVNIKPSPKKRKLLLKFPKRTSPRKKVTPTKSNQNHRNKSESDSDSDIIIQTKKPRRTSKTNGRNETSETDCSEISFILGKNISRVHQMLHNKNSCKVKCSGTQPFQKEIEKTSSIKLNKENEVTITKSRPPSPLSYKSVSSSITSITEYLGSGMEIKIAPKKSLTSAEEGRLTKQSSSLSDEDFDEIIPGSLINKKLLKSPVRKKSNSMITSMHNCSEYYKSSPSGSEGLVSVEPTDPPSSPEVVIPSKSYRRAAAVLSSSSDSDLPLASLINNKMGNNIKSKLNVIKPIKENKIEGIVKAGKLLRSPNKMCLNGSSNKIQPETVKTEINASSDKDSDSGKSTGSKDSSFVPSNESSSQQSDSAFSVESTDRMTTSTTSSTTTSTEDNTCETQSSDPSYSEESDIKFVRSKLKYKTSPKTNRREYKVAKMNKINAKSLSSQSDTSSSEISVRKKLYFGGKRKSPEQPQTIVLQEKKISKVGSLYSSDNVDKAGWQLLLSKMRTGCFPSDLKIDSEDSLTVASSCSGSDTSRSSAMLPVRQCPFYKRIPDTPFAVDAFQYWNIPGVKAYFLSHFHSDHYIGLKKSFSHPIYCTQITANLVRMKLRVEEKWLHILQLNQSQMICGVEVTALDANHCPGSAMFLFSLTNGLNYLHVGDFRASKTMTFYPQLRTVNISKLFLDTTYCSPQYCFPSQEEVIRRIVDIISEKVKNHPRTLVVCGSYTIGKEKVFLGIAEALDWHIWARPEKQRIFSCLNDARINSRLIKDPRSANLHVLPMANIQIQLLKQHLQSCSDMFTHVIGVKPTGWELNTKSQNFKVISADTITIYGVPYSEHSSFLELREFVQFLQPSEVVPTVNVTSAAGRGKMNKYFIDWLNPSSQHSETQTKVFQYFKKSDS